MTSRSTSGALVRSHRSTLPVPSITVSDVSGGVTYATALPFGTGFQSNDGAPTNEVIAPVPPSFVATVRGKAVGS